MEIDVSWPKAGLNLLREKLTSGLEVRVAPGEVARGEEVDATVSVDDPRRMERLEVGLVCTEEYSRRSEDERGYPRELTAYATAYEEWVPLAGEGEQTVRLKVPADGPFSYQGGHLKYRWHAVARGVRRLRPDLRATCDLEVRP